MTLNRRGLLGSPVGIVHCVHWTGLEGCVIEIRHHDVCEQMLRMYVYTLYIHVPPQVHTLKTRRESESTQLV